MNTKNREGNTPLHWASNKDIVQVLVEKGADVTAKRNDGITPLHIAAYLGRTEVALLLIANGAEVNATDKDGDTPLHWAIYKGNIELAQLLIENGAEVTVTDNEGNTPLHLASLTKNQEIVQYIQEHLKTTFLSKLNSEITTYKDEGKQNQIDKLFYSPISLENVATKTDKIILLNNHLYLNFELQQLTKTICPITRRKINDCDKLDVTNEIKNIWSNIP